MTTAIPLGALAPPPRIGRLVLLGHPVAHSLSPLFQQAALDADGVPLRYEAVDVAPDSLDAVIDGLRCEVGAGNVTAPHKAAAAARCDTLAPLAAQTGAVNTFWCDAAGRLVGDNTDVGGFLAAARTVLDPARGAPDVVALVGAGGSAAAVVAAVAAEWPAARLCIWSRTRARAEALASGAPDSAEVVAALHEALAGAALVVNATPLGHGAADALPVEPAALPPEAAVLDLVYARGETRWVRACRAAGHRAADGLTMLVEQGALSYARWFGRPPDREPMWEAIGRATGRWR